MTNEKQQQQSELPVQFPMTQEEILAQRKPLHDILNKATKKTKKQMAEDQAQQLANQPIGA